MKKLFILLAVLGGLIVNMGTAVADTMQSFAARTPIEWGKLPFLNRDLRRDKAFQSKILGLTLCNSKGSLIRGRRLDNTKGLGLPSHIQGRPLLNSNGDVNMASAGYQYIMDTLSYIRSKVIEQKFYQVPIADYVPVDVGDAAWSDEIVQNLTFLTGGGFFDGDIDGGQGGERLASVDAAVAPVRMPIRTWAKASNWTIMEIAFAAQASKWDIVTSKLESLKKNWDLGLQQVTFLGHPSVASITGLLNNGQVNISTTLLPTSISKMTTAQVATLLAQVLGAYFLNSNSTDVPDTWLMPTSDYLGLTTPFSSAYPMISVLTYMEDAMKKGTGNPGFKIICSAYNQAANNLSAGIGKQRHVLYKRTPDVLSLNIPVDFTMLEASSYNKINWQQPAYGQYSGVLVTRPREILYMDVQSS